MANDRKELLKKLPKVDKLFRDPQVKPLAARYPKKMVTEEIRLCLKRFRERILNDPDFPLTIEYDTIVKELVTDAALRLENSLKRAINGVGVILHTAMGRAPYAKEAQKELMDVVAHYCTLQVDQETGKRGDRYVHVEKLICQLTGAEAALVVNNNAAATMLVLNTLSKDKEVIVSRGELVEIGGAFRIPDVMERSGAILREVGTTNRTHLKDYKEAMNEETTGLVLRVHQSNYAIIGFTKMVAVDELAKLAHDNGFLLFDDLGSGALVDFARWGLPHEPTVQESLKDGSDVVCFSGDKLLGGPQCGIIVGKKEVIERMKKNQLTRALRCDKMTFAILEGTLRLFLDEKKLLKEHPVISMLVETPYEVKKRCMSLKRRMKVAFGNAVKLRVVEDVAEVGSGSMSNKALPSYSLAIRAVKLSAECLAAKLRKCNPPIFGRINDDRYLLNGRTIRSDEVKFILQALEQALEIPANRSSEDDE